MVILTSWPLKQAPQRGGHLVRIRPDSALEGADLAAQLAGPLPQAPTAVCLGRQLPLVPSPVCCMRLHQTQYVRVYDLSVTTAYKSTLKAVYNM